MTLTKKDMIDHISKNHNLPKFKCTRMMESLFNIIESELEEGNPIKISGFGKWTVNEQKARTGRNPQTGETLIIEPRKVVTFRPSDKLKNSINNK